MENYTKHECIEFVANEGYVITNYKEGDKRIDYRRTMHVSPDVEYEYYAMKESDARIKEIQLFENEREEMLKAHEEA